MRRTKQLLFFVICAVLARPAWADECVDPYERAVLSPAKTFAVQLTPQKRDCSKDYCDDDPKTTGELKGDPKAPTLTLFALGLGKKRVQKWSRLLEDGYEPMGMAVSDDGRHVILADRWCDSGLGKDVVVLLGPDGARLQAWSLAEILPPDYVAALVQTSFNMHWRGGVSYDPKAHAFSFQVAVPNGDMFVGRSVDLLLDPDAQRFAPRDPAAWQVARSIGRARVEAICADRRWELTRAAVPLSAPTDADRRTWLNFAMEVEKRLAYPTSGSVWNERLFLPARSDPEYESDLTEFRRRLTLVRSDNIAGNFYVVTPDLPNAHAVLKEFLTKEKDKDLGNDRFVIVGDEPEASQVAATIAASGGKDVRIIGLHEALPPAAKQEDYDWRGKRACAAIEEGGESQPAKPAA
jgi:hypothetical protein